MTFMFDKKLNLSGRNLASFKSLISELANKYADAEVLGREIEPHLIRWEIHELFAMAFGEQKLMEFDLGILNRKTNLLMMEKNQMRSELNDAQSKIEALEKEKNPLITLSNNLKKISEAAKNMANSQKERSEENHADSETEPSNPD